MDKKFFESTIEKGTPIVSIIVPIYNTEKYLRTCLDSILTQTFTDFEVILVDDGSVDSSGRICDEYAAKDKRFVVVHKPNEGVSVSRNKGLSLAKGDYVSFIDSDDFIHPQMIEFLYYEINNHNCSFSMVLEESVHEDNYTIKNKNILNYKTEIIRKKDCIYNLTHEGNEKKNFVHLLGKLYNKDCLYGIKFDEDISLSEDLLFNFEFYLKKGNGIRILLPMYFRTLLRGDSLSSRKPTDMIYNAEIYQKSLSLIPSNEKVFRSYVLENIMNRIVNFKRVNRKTELRYMAKDRGRILFSIIKNEFFKNNHISWKKKIKLLIKYHLF